MNLTIRRTFIERLKKEGCTDPILTGGRGYGEYETIEHRGLTREAFEKLYKVAKSVTPARDTRILLRDMDSILALAKGMEGKKIKQLPIMAEALRVLIGGTAHRWVFEPDGDSQVLVPYVVTSIRYHPSEGSGDNYVPAKVQLKGEALRRGDEVTTSATIHRADLVGGITAEECLINMGYRLETPELVEAFTEDLDKYEDVKKNVGQQYLAVGRGTKCNDNDSYYYSHGDRVRLEVDGAPGKVIVDDNEGWSSDEATTHVEDWSTGFFRNEEAKKFAKEGEELDEDDDRKVDDDDDDDSKGIPATIVRKPEHPIVRVFSLYKHVFATTHISNLDPYLYQREIFDKLVLPAAIKTLVDALVGDSKDGDDIISGKGMGIIILLYGPPGCGKTLTAEAYSEKLKRPVYTVQCSQLGTSPTKLEKELSTVLKRAERWGALLLIDESDVYTHERGDDVYQNAMVGVFLRLLEYYKGVLFLTTNREGEIDDAIRSRCIAEIRFGEPTKEDAKKIWKIQFDQYKVFPAGVRPDFVNDLVATFPDFSGRTIKHVTRLAKLLATSAGRHVPGLDDFKEAAKYQKLEMVKPSGKSRKVASRTVVDEDGDSNGSSDNE